MEYICNVTSPVGMLTLLSDGEHLTGLWMEGQKYFGSTLTEAESKEDLPVFDRTREWLASYFAGKDPGFSLPLAPKGSEFRQKVWRVLCEIPYGQVTTYGGIAKKLEEETGKRVSAQAVGGAVGHNPISIVVPCHRVVGADGSLTGYAGGVHVKERLLNLERVDMRELYVPKTGTAL